MSEVPQSAEERSEMDLLLRGFQVSRMLRLVADLGVADKIDPNSKINIRDLAESCGILEVPLFRVLRALASFRIFHVSADGLVSHTQRSALLRKDSTDSLYNAARFWTAPGSWGAWGELDEAMTGQSPHKAAWGVGRFDYLREHAGEARAFDAMMPRLVDNGHAAIAEAYDFSAAHLIADIGGGNGSLLRHILTRFTHVRGLVLDLCDVVAALGSEDLLDGRISTQVGSFFDPVPDGADIYLLSRVLHDWSDEDCVRILASCRRAMPADGRLLVSELILDADPTVGEPSFYLTDMQMMAMFGEARERTQPEFENLFEQSGFALSSVFPTASPVSIIEARPV